MLARTKIVCTMGPAVATPEKIRALIEAGMSVARLNFSHGSHDEHVRTIALLKEERKRAGRPVAIMLDTRGPEIRIGDLPGGEMPIEAGQRYALVGKASLPGEIGMGPVEVLSSVSKGMRVLFDDGYLMAEAVDATAERAEIVFKNGGVLKSRKKINLPDAQIHLPALTQKDIADLRFGCAHDIDYVAASFIRSSHHVLSIKELLAQEGKPHIQVIAKIESQQGIAHFDSIVQVADGIMIARGDLGVELDLALVPKLSKMMIRKSRMARKPVITATQMLESMIQYPRPTRAEVSDVANAIYDSTSCIMLSAETAIGKYPVETVQQMHQIAAATEKDIDYRDQFEEQFNRDYHDISSAVSLAAVKTAFSANAKAIFAFTSSGMTARHVSRLSPDMPIIALTPSPKTYQQLALIWGVHPVLAEGCLNVKEAFSIATQYALDKGLIAFGDVVVVTAGTPFGKKGSTNMMLVESIGEVLVRGHKGFGHKTSGEIAIVLSPENGSPAALAGRLVVISYCDNTFLPLLKEAAGLILQNHIGDTASEKYAALVAKTFEIPVITRADGAMTVLQPGDLVTLDPQRGLVYRGSEEAPTCPAL
jgi:pyruvate kinase